MGIKARIRAGTLLALDAEHHRKDEHASRGHHGLLLQCHRDFLARLGIGCLGDNSRLVSIEGILELLR